MKQYWDIKTLHQDKILMFRMGDFFEMFYDDAVKAAPLLGIALTQRNKKSLDETPMCGMPHHSVAGPINKLLSHGLKVAICDQIEDPKLAKGLVKRAVTRVLTPGMVFDSDTLEATEAHYMASIDDQSLSVLDTSTGESFYFKSKDFNILEKYLDVLPVVELVVSSSFIPSENFKNKYLISHCDEIARSYPSLVSEEAPVSAARLLNYVISLSSEETLKTFSKFTEKKVQGRLHLSATVLRHLEVFSNYKGEAQGSFFQAIHRCQTSSGARLLRQWISFPLRDFDAIEDRQRDVTFWRENMIELKRVRQVLSHMGDVERRLGKIAQPQCHGRDLLSLANSVRAGIEALEMVPSDRLQKFAFNVAPLFALSEQIESTLVEEPPLTVKQGYMIRKGVSTELDELIELSTDSQALILKMENEEKEKTGISSLKIRYNNVFGYYIEITNTHKDKAPARYQRKQTLANAERYCTEELVELERKVLSAQTKRADLEFEYFETLKNKILSLGSELLTLAHECSELDVLTSLAWLSLEENYCPVKFVEDGDFLLKGSRHPVIEQFLRGQFVANDIDIKQQNCLLLTGPNMAGKSTLMRQVALTVILAQMGSYVPATMAEMPLFDAIFTRIGASDQLSEGLSTFMVEMTETSLMLKNCTPRSLVILDEVGRGTSTFDGMCLAQSILEYLISEKRVMTLFATHYHELTTLESEFSQLKNAHMTVSERSGEMKFLHSLAKGPALKSYGIQVAELAGLPNTVTKRAKVLLKDIEKSKSMELSSQLSFMDSMFDGNDHQTLDSEIKDEESLQVKLELSEKTKELEALKTFLQEFQSFSLQSASPLQALNQIAKWQEELQNKS